MCQKWLIRRGDKYVQNGSSHWNTLVPYFLVINIMLRWKVGKHGKGSRRWRFSRKSNFSCGLCCGRKWYYWRIWRKEMLPNQILVCSIEGLRNWHVVFLWNMFLLDKFSRELPIGWGKWLLEQGWCVALFACYFYWAKTKIYRTISFLVLWGSRLSCNNKLFAEIEMDFFRFSPTWWLFLTKSIVFNF